MNVYHSIWSDSRFFSLFLYLLFLALNVYTVVMNMQRAASSKVQFGNGIDEFQVSLLKGRMEMCDRHLNVTGCVSTDLSRFRSFQIVSFMECGLVVGLTVVIACFLFAFVVCGATSLPAKYPFIFIVAPRWTCCLSGLFFLQFANLERFFSLYLKGEMKFWSWIVLETFCPMTPAKEPAKDERMADTNTSREEATDHKIFTWTCGCGRKRRPYVVPEDQKLEQAEYDYGFEDADPPQNADGAKKHRKCRDRVVFLIATLGYICLLCLSLNALLIKLTTIVFSAVKGAEHWSGSEILFFVGFVNQVVGICPVGELEMHRVLLFNFGGSEASWNYQSYRACKEYLSLLADKIVEGKITETRGRVGALAALMTIFAEEAQALLLSPERERRMQLAHADRLQVLQELYTSKNAISFMEKMEILELERLDLMREWKVARQQRQDGADARFRGRKEQLDVSLRRLIEEHGDKLEQVRNQVLDKVKVDGQSRPAGRADGFRLAAEVQDWLEDLQLLAAKGVKTDELMEEGGCYACCWSCCCSCCSSTTVASDEPPLMG